MREPRLETRRVPAPQEKGSQLPAVANADLQTLLQQKRIDEEFLPRNKEGWGVREFPHDQSHLRLPRSTNPRPQRRRERRQIRHEWVRLPYQG